MTEPTHSGQTPDLASVAAEDPEESVERQREAVGDAPDTGDTVATDDAQ